jgi:hypothetical protein
MYADKAENHHQNEGSKLFSVGNFMSSLTIQMFQIQNLFHLCHHTLSTLFSMLYIVVESS